MSYIYQVCSYLKGRHKVYNNDSQVSSDIDNRNQWLK